MALVRLKCKRLSKVVEDYSFVHSLEELVNEVISGKIKLEKDETYLTSTFILYHQKWGDFNMYIADRQSLDRLDEKIDHRKTLAEGYFLDSNQCAQLLAPVWKNDVVSIDYLSVNCKRFNVSYPMIFDKGNQVILKSFFGRNWEAFMHKIEPKYSRVIMKLEPMWGDDLKKYKKGGFLAPISLIYDSLHLNISAFPLPVNTKIWISAEYKGKLSLDDDTGHLSMAKYGELSLAD
tara:strand:- start:21167 stop:21868 length:702 start_codon:yes stop_codon:yes gene_type:complete